MINTIQLPTDGRATCRIGINNAPAFNAGRSLCVQISRERSYPCQYIDTTRKAIDCATTLPLTVFGRPFVKQFALCYRSVVLSVCLSVTLVYRVLWPMDQDETWHGGRPRPRSHCVRWRPSSPFPTAHVCCGQTVVHLSYC